MPRRRLRLLHENPHRAPDRCLAATCPLVLLAACGKQEQVSEVDWAKAALARNPALEIVATDETAGMFSVRDTTTGAMYTAALEELIAAPLPSKLAASRAAPAAAPAAEAAPAETAAPRGSRGRSNYRGRRRRARLRASRWPKVRDTASRAAHAQDTRPDQHDRRPGLQHHARRPPTRHEPADAAAPRASPTSRNAPIPSSARATASCASTARPWSSRAMR